MKRTTPMKRTGFKPKAWTPRAAKQVDYTPTPRAPAVARHDGKARMVVQVPKDEPVQHEGYRRLVAAMPCARCKVWGYSQHAHSNTGKGMGIKTDCRLGFPLCSTRPGVVGCHALLDQGAMYSKHARREMEDYWAWDTRMTLRRLRLWPKDLAPWPEDEEVTA